MFKIIKHVTYLGGAQARRLLGFLLIERQQVYTKCHVILILKFNSILVFTTICLLHQFVYGGFYNKLSFCICPTSSRATELANKHVRVKGTDSLGSCP